MEDGNAARETAGTSAPPFGGRYEYLRELGQGGMGRVFAARDRKLSREVAVKLLKETVDDANSIARFEQEARAAGALNHPNVVTVFDIGWEAGRPYIVSEILRGVTLRERIASGPVALEEAIALALQLASGLSAAHALGIVHRDLKPANLFLTEHRTLKILDFGIAKLLRSGEGETSSEDVSGPHTDKGRILGTAGYMSPEQVRGLAVDQKSDVFNFAIVLCELLTGQNPFKRASSMETAWAIVSDEPALPGQLPAALDRLVRSCLRKTAAERPAIAAVARILQEVRAATPAESQTPARASPALPRGSRRLVRALVAGGAAAVLICAWALRLALLDRAEQQPWEPGGAVAVLPFAVEGGPEFDYLGEGMVDLLTGGLVSAGIRVVEPQEVLRGLSRGSRPFGEQARAAAQRLGAASYVIGTVAGSGRGLRVDAELRDARDGARHGKASASGEPDQIFKLIDGATASLARRLRPGVQPMSGRLDRLASMSTQSTEALRHYLEGESYLRRNDWKSATAAFQQATALDLEFALAHYRLAVAAAMQEPGLSDDSLQRALRYANRLSPHDKALLETWALFQRGRAGDAEKSYQAIVAEHPDDAEGWFQLGELLFHWNPLRGRSASEASDAFGRALVLEPSHGAALVHMIDLAQMRGQRDLVVALADRYLQGDHDEGATSALPLRWTRAWATGDERVRVELREALRPSPRALREAFIRSTWQDDDLADALMIATLLSQSPTNAMNSYGFLCLAVLELAHGRPEAARARMEQALRASSDAKMQYYALWMETLELGPPDPQRLALARAAGEKLDLSRDPATNLFRLHALGVLAVRAGDPAAARAYAERLDAQPTPAQDSIASDLARSIRAQVALSGERFDEARSHLDGMQLRVPYNLVGAFSHVAPRRVRARLEEQENRPAEALRLETLADYYDPLASVFFAPTHLRKARLLEKTGQPASAAQEYDRFAKLWRDCEPPLRPQVEEALARSAKLRNALATERIHP